MPFATKLLEAGVSGRSGVDQGGLPLGRTDQDRVALAHVEDLDRRRLRRRPGEELRSLEGGAAVKASPVQKRASSLSLSER